MSENLLEKINSLNDAAFESYKKMRFDSDKSFKYLIECLELTVKDNITLILNRDK